MYIIIAIVSYFINAGVYVADKFLLSKKIHSSITYAFYVGVWSIFNIALLVFAPWLPTFRELCLDLLAGLLFLGTLIFWYKALHQSEATRVVPVVGALIPIFSFIFGYIFLGETFGERQLLAFIVLINGGILISVKHTKFYAKEELFRRFKDVFGDIFGTIHAHYRPARRLLVNSVVSAIFFATYYILIKYIYTEQPFVGGFVWSRMGTFLGVILILFMPNWRRKILSYRHEARAPKNLGFFILIRLLAAAAFIMLNWAISLGPVAMINALQGVQYAFLFMLILFLSSRYPKIVNEELGGGVMLQKIIGIILITVGLYMLVIT